MGQDRNSGQGQAGEHPQSKIATPARVFVGLKIAPDIATQLAEFATALNQPSVRRVASADIHLTLVPPWNEAFIPEAIKKLRRVAVRCEAFWLSLRRISYGPQPRRPRLLWVDCGTGEAIITLRTALLEVYGQTDERPFQPHVTLARIRSDGPLIARKYPMDRLSLAQHVDSVELFQSPPPGETGYRTLASCRLRKSSDALQIGS